MKYVFTVVVPTARYIDITADFKLSMAGAIMTIEPIRSKVGHVIGYNAIHTIDGDFKKGCNFENKLKMLGYHYVIRKVD
ncbi:hypothetical protein Ah1_00086 [Aeromonas phage Ah1]|uniref:Uncharacterized protein n=1 Tax=Aeromonas phage Ah1 TaxID=2053701 RepID=A0A2H4YEM0_9CAUD|nr:hypothetical protein KNT77_gp086 [Aeromonas phage Ah1]AUE22627.1 hypothetical protein Ah1_00086 [Aeromonas phage Ah1]